jgi:hypothetical protein
MSADGSKSLKGEVADEAEVPMLPATPIPALAGIFLFGYPPPAPDGLTDEDERHRGSKIPIHAPVAG